MKELTKVLLIAIAFLLSGMSFGAPAKLKDIVNIKGIRDNQLIGFGIVVGLQGTGDTGAAVAANKSLTNLIKRLGMDVGTISSTGAVAGVVVTSALPPFSKIGDKVDLKLSTIGDATSLQGGTLILTSLKSGDGQVYVIGQGAVVTGQATGAANRVLTVATVPEGGVVEKEFDPIYSSNGELTLSLKKSDFTNASRVVEVINKNYRGYFAKTTNPGTITVEIPPLHKSNPVDFIAGLESLKIEVDRKAKVVVNERTGTVVMGDSVIVQPIAIAHGELSIKVDDAKEGGDRVGKVNGTTIGELIQSLNQMGAGPDDLVGILKAVHSAGALQADLEFL
jgi:flagellar P-ring protein precursor FlgI